MKRRWIYFTLADITPQKRQKKPSHPDGHVSNISIFWAFHEYKCRVSGVLNDDFLCYFSRSCKIITKVQRGTKQMHNCNQRLHTHIHTSSDHCDRRLDVDPFVCVNARVDEYQTVKVRLLTSSESILDGVVVLERTSQVRGMTGELKWRKEKKCCKQFTYKHVISPFVSGRITVEVFCKARLYMRSFIL